MTDLSSYKSLKTGLEVVYAAVVEFGHLLEQLLVLSLKVFLDWSELFPGLRCEEEREKGSLSVASFICNFMQNTGVDVLVQTHSSTKGVAEVS